MRWFWIAAAAGAASAFVPAMSAAQEARGVGQEATRLFPLRAGLAVFDLAYEGDGAFTVRLMNDSGAVLDTLAQAHGAFRGSKAVRIPRTGMYLLDVAATGEWSVQLRSGETAVGPTVAAATTGATPAAVAAAPAIPDWQVDAMVAGEQHARGSSPAKWMLGGLVGGLTLGPLGAGAVLIAANRRPDDPPASLIATLDEKDPAYVQVFTDAYRAKRRSDRRVGALVGGAVGTVIFTVAVLQLANWDSGSSGSGGGGGGEVP